MGKDYVDVIATEIGGLIGGLAVSILERATPSADGLLIVDDLVGNWLEDRAKSAGLEEDTDARERLRAMAEVFIAAIEEAGFKIVPQE